MYFSSFGASWCTKCKEEFPQIDSFYDQLKAKGLEVIIISLEDKQKISTDFRAKFPFPSYSDLKKWEIEIVRDCYVFATPPMFLLNYKKEIIP